MVYFHTKNVILGIRWCISWPFGVFIANLVCFVYIWYFCVAILVYFPRFSLLCHDKSGSPAHDPKQVLVFLNLNQG
jgi:hypothetical protein